MRPLFLVLLACTAGCGTLPIKTLTGSPPTIHVSGAHKLKGLEATFDDPVEVARIQRLINRICTPTPLQWTAQYNFEISDSEGVAIEIERAGQTAEYFMMNGCFQIPNQNHAEFYTSHEKERAELWQLLKAKLETQAVPEKEE